MKFNKEEARRIATGEQAALNRSNRTDQLNQTLIEALDYIDFLEGDRKLTDAERRINHIGLCLHGMGHFNRRYLIQEFGISKFQASVDIKEYLKRYPQAMTYNKSERRYEAPSERR